MSTFGKYTSMGTEEVGTDAWTVWTPDLPFFARLRPITGGVRVHISLGSLSARIAEFEKVKSPFIAHPLEVVCEPDPLEGALYPPRNPPGLTNLELGWTLSVHAPGPTVRNLIADAQLPLNEATAIVYQACLGLQDVRDQTHTRPVHTCLSMNALRVGGGGVTRVEAWDMPMQGDIQTEGVMVGVASAMSPEQLLEEAPVDERSLVYQLGIILYQLLTGHHPLTPPGKKMTFPVHFEALNRGNLKPPSHHRACISPGLDSIVMTALHRSPSSRHQSLGILADALAEVCDCRPPELLQLDLNEALEWARQRIYDKDTEALLDLLFSRPGLRREGTLTQYIADHMGKKLVAEVESGTAGPVQWQLLSLLGGCQEMLSQVSGSAAAAAICAILAGPPPSVSTL